MPRNSRVFPADAAGSHSVLHRRLLRSAVLAVSALVQQSVSTATASFFLLLECYTPWTPSSHEYRTGFVQFLPVNEEFPSHRLT